MHGHLRRDYPVQIIKVELFHVYPKLVPSLRLATGYTRYNPSSAYTLYILGINPDKQSYPMG